MARKRRNRYGESKHSARRLFAADRARRCLELATEGKRHADIAKIVGLTRTGVVRAIDAALARAAAPAAAEYRARELVFLESRRKKIIEHESATFDPDVETVLLRNSKAICDLLGLNAPAKLEHSGELGITGEVKVDHDYGRIKELLKDPEFRAFASRLLIGRGNQAS